MNISELMDNYIDDEFFIGGEGKANAETVFKNVSARAKPRKHLKLRTKIIAATAAAVLGVSAITGWTFSSTVLITRTGEINEWSVLGSSTRVEAATEVEPYEVIDGRVYFTAVDEGEEAIDVTDTVCSDRAFIYEYVQEDSRGNEHICLLAIGGDPENMGYAEAVYGAVQGNKGYSFGVKYGAELFYWINGKAVAEKELTEEQRERIGEYPKSWVDKPWTFEFRAAAMRLAGNSEKDIEKILKDEREKSSLYYYTPEEGTGIIEPFVPGVE